ncbi:MAG TPA: gamma-glutamyltransferase [Limnochordia bacterium]|nr:gamma-glutamyltransferase [Limnochordia bacterium]
MPLSIAHHPKRFGAGRAAVVARRGAVSTSQPLATDAGLDVLKAGGSALDAAIAASAVLSVVEPMSCGLGGDVFALVYDAAENRVYGYNGSGRSGAAAKLGDERLSGRRSMPAHGALSVTVPGQVEAWSRLHERFGRRPWSELFQAARHYAGEGFGVAPITADMWAAGTALLAQRPATAEVYLPGGQAPRAGEVVRNPGLARTLAAVAEGGVDAFYRGEVAREIVRALREEGGWLTEADLAEHAGEWVEPLRARYRGIEVLELPPNGQGISALMALRLLDGFDLSAHPHGSAESLHLIAEALKLAFADLRYFVTDPEHERVPTAGLLDEAYLSERRGLIDPARAMPQPKHGTPPGWQPSDTVYLCTADAQGNLVSFISSISGSWGSGVVGGRTGLILQNRGASFSLDPAHPNHLAPRKRPFHTIIPAMLAEAGRPIVAFGVMGGPMQPQGHLQFVSNLVDYGMNLQDALDAPRVQVTGDGRLAVEPGLGDAAARQLAERGHGLVSPGRVFFGSGQAIQRLDSGVLVGAADHRRDGCAGGF